MATAEQGAAREFLFTVADFERVRRLIYERAGIALGEHKQEMVYSRLARRLRALRLACFRTYLDLVEADRSSEWDEFTNALTTNLTAFFREAHHFDTLRERLRGWAVGRRCRIWCAASSTGEEPYSIAMTMVEAFSPVWYACSSPFLPDEAEVTCLMHDLWRLDDEPSEPVARLDLGCGNPGHLDQG